MIYETYVWQTTGLPRKKIPNACHIFLFNALPLTGLKIEFIEGIFEITLEKNPNDFLSYAELVENITKILGLFNTVDKKGYVTVGTVIPIASEFTNEYFPKIKLDKTEIEKSKSFRCQYWVYEFFIASLYLVMLSRLKGLKEMISSRVTVQGTLSKRVDRDVPDIFFDYSNLMKRLYISLDPCIKQVIQRRGLTLLKNVYAGYDTEYTVDNFEKHLNKLVSCQVAVNHKIFLRVPQKIEFQIGEIDAKTGELRVHKSSGIFEKIIERSIRKVCEKIRHLTSGSLDEFTQSLIKRLQGDSVDNFSRRNMVTFGFKRSPVVTDIKYPCERGMGFQSLLD
ncbi:hypothetical protein K3495_g13965 [Podosphaera aphanis]|nr:hypothetical protein K3495_g13965 [Podosphaera aphanis]